MSIEVLEIISKAMSALGLEYGFGEYKGKTAEETAEETAEQTEEQETRIVYPYFVGEYMETEPTTEDGLQETTFILTGFSRGEDARLTLEDAKNEIEKHFNPSTGRVGITNSGSAVVIFYAGAVPVPKEDAELKSIQINLSIKEWKVI